MNVYVNDVYLPYIKCEYGTQIFFGGASSGKSYFHAQRIVLDCIGGINTLVVRNVGITLRKSSFNEIKKSIYSMGVAHLFKVNETEMTCTCISNGRQILFSGLDNVEKLKSVTPAVGVLERIFIEEATEIKREAYLQLKKRLRGWSPVKKSITLAFNPILKAHWIYKEFFEGWDETKNLLVDEKRSLLILKTTYQDNRFLTDDDIAALEDETDPYFYKVYTLGEWGVLGNLVFRNWRTADLSEMIPRFDDIRNGLDFGYINPTAFIRVQPDADRKILYVFGEKYMRGQSYDSLSEELQKTVGDEYITCDSEDPRAIFELGQHGLRTIPARKGPNSVLHGIKWLQGYTLVVDVDCQNLINELSQYHWETDKDGNVIERAAKKFDHLIDALRYATEELQTVGKVTVGGRI